MTGVQTCALPICSLSLLQHIFPTQGSNWGLLHCRRILYQLSYHGFPYSLVGKESTCNAGGPGLIPGLGRSAGEGIGYPLQYSWASLVAQLVRNLPAMQETQETVSMLYSPWGCKEWDTTERLSLSLIEKQSRISIKH